LIEYTVSAFHSPSTDNSVIYFLSLHDALPIYLHMSGFAKGISKGVRVKQGDVIGYVGSTGLATGPHLCYRFWKNGKQVDPFKEKIPSSHPVKPELLEAYNKKKAEVIAALNNIKLPFEMQPEISSVIE